MHFILYTKQLSMNFSPACSMILRYKRQQILSKPILNLYQNTHKYFSSSDPMIQNFLLYTSNSIFAQSFIGVYQVLESSLGCSSGIALITSVLGLRLITAPLFVYSERLLSRRLIVNNIICQHVAQQFAKHHGVGTKINHNGQWTLDTLDRQLLESFNYQCGKSIYEYVVQEKMTLARIICLKGCSMFLWVEASMGLRDHLDGNIGQAPISGFLWLNSLADVDPYMILPICVGLLSFLNIWISRWMFLAPNEKHGRFLSRFIDVVLISFILYGVNILKEMSAIQPFYWFFVLLTYLCQTLLLRQNTVKRFLSIGKLPTDTNTPFRDLLRFQRNRLPISF